MPRQNRVTPFSRLIATRERGTLNGNRGCLHNERGEIVRQYRGIRWIVCLLEYKGRRHPIMKPGTYTDLFFLDEATALAAGHRPCAECQRGRFDLFRRHWAAANKEKTDSARPLAPVIDAALHRERTALGKMAISADDLPNGTFITDNEIDAYLVFDRELYLWTPAGYRDKNNGRAHFPARVLTPASVVKAISSGYPVAVHPTAVRR